MNAKLQYLAISIDSHDTLKLIDGASPDAGSQDQNEAEPASANGKEPEIEPELQTVPENERASTTKTVETAKEQVPA